MNEDVPVEFRGEVQLFPQKGGWRYVAVPAELSEPFAEQAERGLIPVRATIGSTTWDTSLLPMGDGTHFVALNARVRLANGVDVGDVVTVGFEPRVR